MCHRNHRADTDPLSDVGEKDITAHVDFTAVAVAGQDAGLEVLGYTSQARFLINCGVADDLQAAAACEDFRTIANTQKLITEHEMGELFKLIGFAASTTPLTRAALLSATAPIPCDGVRPFGSTGSQPLSTKSEIPPATTAKKTVPNCFNRA